MSDSVSRLQSFPILVGIPWSQYPQIPGSDPEFFDVELRQAADG